MKKYILLLSSIVAIALTSYFSLLPVGGFTMAQISKMYPTYITPAAFTFSIWSVIYMSWLVLGVGMIFSKTEVPLEKILYLANAQLISALWLVPWQYNSIGLSFLVMLLIVTQVTYISFKPEQNTLFQNTVWLFFGWISIAAILNFHVFLVAKDAYSHGLVLGVTSLIASVALSYYFCQYMRTIIPASVTIWALLGILFLQNNNYIVFTCLCGIIFLLCVIILFFLNETPQENGVK